MLGTAPSHSSAAPGELREVETHSPDHDLFHARVHRSEVQTGGRACVAQTQAAFPKALIS